MIYASQARAQEVAVELNARKGFHESRPVLTPHGWTVMTKAVWG